MNQLTIEKNHKDVYILTIDKFQWAISKKELKKLKDNATKLLEER